MIFNILKTAGGKLSAQLTGLLLIPIITAIFDPGTIGIVLTIIAYCTIFGSVAPLGYNFAIPIVETQGELTLNIRIAACFSLLGALLAGGFISVSFFENIGFSGSGAVFFIVLATALSSVFVQLQVRLNNHGRLAIFYFLQSIVSHFLIILFALIFSETAFVYLAGFGLGLLLPIMLISDFKIKLNNKNEEQKLKCTFVKFLKRYKKYPVYTAPTIFLNTLGTKLPLILVGIYYSATNAGIYGLVERLALAPVGLLGVALGNVYVSELSKAKRNFDRNIKIIFIKYMIVSIVISLSASALLFFTSDYLSSILFSEKWGEVEPYLKVFSVLIFFKLISTSTARVFMVLERQEIALYWNLVRTLLIAISFSVCAFMNYDFIVALICFVIVSAVLDVSIVFLAFSVCVKHQGAKIIPDYA